MNLRDRIEAFSILGEILVSTAEGKTPGKGSVLDLLAEEMWKQNGWFTPGNVRMAMAETGRMLTREKLSEWTGRYNIPENTSPYTVAIVMAGNIPLVGFHDFLCTLISGNKALVKTSSKDPLLIKEIGEILFSINPLFRDYISYTESTLAGFDAVIATGSDNTARYFEEYFGKYYNIIRGNRNSVAVIDGTETDEELKLLGRDVFSYFGLGCRNVSKLLVPAGYSFDRMISSWENYSGTAGNSKYANNLDYNKAIYMVNRERFIDAGFVLIKPDPALASPVGVVYYENYKTENEVAAYLSQNSGSIQCIIGRNHIPYGEAQSPQLWDYADNYDTLEFLLKKNTSGIL